MQVTIPWTKDNAELKEEVSSRISNLISKIADKTLEELEYDEPESIFIYPETVKNAKDISRDQMILKRDNGTYHSGNVIGFIGYEDERLIIGSRFGGEGKDYFSQYLLAKVLDLPNIVDLKFDANQDNRLFNFFLLLFPYHLKTAMRKGLFKEYIPCKYNDMNVKGVVDIARHIQKNTPFIGNIAYTRREFSFSNNLTELVRHTIEFIKRKPYGKALLAKARDEVNLVINATPKYKFHDRQKIIEQNKKNPVRHAYYKEYLALQRLCLLILRHQKHQFGSGKRQVYGVLFDVAWLWEEYVNTLIKDKFHHPMNKSQKGCQYLFDGNFGEIYPDFISRNNEPRIIADAKYKPREEIGAKNHDYYQILAYMHRFEADTGYLLYPEDKGLDDMELQLKSGSIYDEKDIKPRAKTIKVIKHGLKIPVDASDYDDFVEKMEPSEKDFVWW